MSKSFNNSHITGNIPLGTAENFSIACSAAANNLTITINDREGNTPSNTSAIIANFRSATLTTGTSIYRTANSALTFTINDTNTMGVITNTPFRLHLYLFDNAGTMVLGAINCVQFLTQTSIMQPDIGALQTSQSGTNGGSTAQLFYASVSALSSKAIAYLGFIECDSTSFTAGKWGSSGTGLITRVVKWYPGMPMPGNVIVTRNNIDTSQPQTTSSTYQNTSTNTTITPQSKCSMFYVSAAGGLYMSSTATRARAKLHWDSTVFGNECDIYLNAGGLNYGMAVLQGVTYPMTTSAITFYVKFSNTDNITTVGWNHPQTAGASITVQEIST